jgi:hypothetical protein
MIKQESNKSRDVNEMAYSIARAMSRESEAERKARGERGRAGSTAAISRDPKDRKPKARKSSAAERKELSDKVALKRWLRQ